MSDADELASWSAPAVNLPEHADNAIHTDAGAHAAGFPSALVAGVTVYAYMTHVPAAAWGLDWLQGGGAHVRFRSPVFDQDVVNYVPVPAGPDGARVEAQVGGVARSACAVTRVGSRPERCTGVGDELLPIEFVADELWATYATRAGDDLPIYTDDQILHPVTWMRIANQFFHEQIVTGSWIHVRSHLMHHGVARFGATLTATAVVVDRFDSRAGERAILDVRISADGQPVATYEHEAIVKLAEDVGD
jgi:acyl dehydratase